MRDLWATHRAAALTMAIRDLEPDEVRRVAQLWAAPDSNMILVHRREDGRFEALIEANWSAEDPRRVRNSWKSASSLYELYLDIAQSLAPPYWSDPDLAAFFATQ